MDESKFDALFSGLTGKQEETAKTPQQTVTEGSNKGKKKVKRNEEHFCTIVDSDIIKKIRIIAIRERLQIKDVVDAAFVKAILSYERKHGPIDDSIKGDTKNLF